MSSQPTNTARTTRKRARQTADTTDGTTTTTSPTPHGPQDATSPAAYDPHNPLMDTLDSVESVQSTPRPDGPYPATPSTHDGHMLPHESVYTTQPIRAEEVTVWALALARTATQGVVRNVARQDAVGFGGEARVMQRLLELRTSTASPTGHVQLKTSRAQNVDAMYGYMFGDVAHVPCATCKKSCGPFTDCVVHPEIGGGSCTNCHYGSMGNRCTLRTGEATASTPRPRKRAKAEKEEEEERVRVAHVSQRSLAALKKLKTAHWEAIQELAGAVAEGKWEFKEEPHDSDLDL